MTYQMDLFRPLNLTEVAVTENFVYVAPFELNAIYQHDLQGNLLRVIGRKGEGPGEFQFISMVGTEGDQVLAVSVRRPTHVFKFSTEGKLVREYALPEKIRPFWPYKTQFGWLLPKMGRQSFQLATTLPDFSDPKVLLQTTRQHPVDRTDLEGKRVLWKLARNQKTVFYVSQHEKKLLVFDLATGDKHAKPLDVDAIPDPKQKNNKLPLFTDIDLGPGDTCLIFTGANKIHRDLPPLVFDAAGQKPALKFSAESWRRLIEIRGKHAWVTTFEESFGACIRRLEVPEVDGFTTATSFEFTEADLRTYIQSRK